MRAWSYSPSPSSPPSAGSRGSAKSARNSATCCGPRSQKCAAVSLRIGADLRTTIGTPHGRDDDADEFCAGDGRGHDAGMT